MELKHYELYVKKHLREWHVTYKGGLPSMSHASSYSRKPDWVFKRIKREFGREVVDAVLSKMLAAGGEQVYEERLKELAYCYLEVMRVYKEFYPAFETQYGISVHRFISRLELMAPEGVPYLLSALFPENSMMVRMSGGRFTTELYRMQDWRVRMTINVQLLHDKRIDQVPQHTSNPDGPTVPADGARVSFSRVCEVGDETVFPFLKARAEMFTERLCMTDIMEDVCDIPYPR